MQRLLPKEINAKFFFFFFPFIRMLSLFIIIL